VFFYARLRASYDAARSPSHGLNAAERTFNVLSLALLYRRISVISGILNFDQNFKIQRRLQMANMFFVWKDPNCNGVNPEWIQMTGKQFHEFITRPENQKRKFIKEYVDPYNRRLGFYRFEVTLEVFRKWDANRKRDLRAQRNDMLNLPRLSAVDKDELSEQEDYCFTDGVEEDDEVDLSFDEDAALLGEGYDPDEDCFGMTNNNSDEESDEEECEAIPFVVSLDEIAYVEEQLTMHDVIADPSVDVEKSDLCRVILEDIKQFIKKYSGVDFLVAEYVVDRREKEKTHTRFAKELGISRQVLEYKIKKIRKEIKKNFAFA
jgi:hypothetical protein